MSNEERITNLEEQVKNQQELLNDIAETCYIAIRKFAENFGFIEDIEDKLNEAEDKLSKKTAPENSEAENIDATALIREIIHEAIGNTVEEKEGE